jgi:hypothetical protein
MDEEIKKILEDHETRIARLEKNQLKKEEGRPSSIPTKITKDKLLQESGLNDDQIQSIFLFGDTDISLIIPPEGSDREKQLAATLSILTAYNYCLNKNEIKASELLVNLKMLGIGLLTHLAETLKKEPRYIQFKRKGRKKDTVYKITYPGLERGLEIIRQLLGVKTKAELKQ